MKEVKCMVYVLLWYFSDGSDCGVVKTYNTEAGAAEMLELLREHGNRSYEIIESEFIYA